jgi:hypothetical protein
MQAAYPLSLRHTNTGDTNMDGRPHSGVIPLGFSPYRSTGGEVIIHIYLLFSANENLVKFHAVKSLDK